MIFVTGGAGFIGANFVLDWLANVDEPVVNIDKLTYAGNLENLASLNGDKRHIFVQADIGDGGKLTQLLAEHHPLPGRLYSDQCGWHLQIVGSSSRLLEWSGVRQKGRFPFSACFDR